MTTLAKAESNRRNAQRSTGPRTRQGKATSSKNALRHGLLSKQIVLPDEDRDAFISFSKEMTEQFAPQGPLEALLVECVTANAWRLRRVWRLESGVLACRMLEARGRPVPNNQRTTREESSNAVKAAEQTQEQRDPDPIAAAVIRDAAGADALSKLSRYERTLERGMYRALHELQRRQAARSGQNVPPPAVLDVEVSSNPT